MTRPVDRRREWYAIDAARVLTMGAKSLVMVNAFADLVQAKAIILVTESDSFSLY
jgi:hypothetical protein